MAESAGGTFLCKAYRISSSADSDTDVSAFEGGCIVDAVAGHAHAVAQLPQRLHYQVLVLRVHLQPVQILWVMGTLLLIRSFTASARLIERLVCAMTGSRLPPGIDVVLHALLLFADRSELHGAKAFLSLRRDVHAANKTFIKPKTILAQTVHLAGE